MKNKSKVVPARQWKRLEARFRAAWWRASPILQEAYVSLARAGEMDFHDLVTCFEVGVEHEESA
eukprot:7508810-Pyramimonas_sp.AAC.1